MDLCRHFGECGGCRFQDVAYSEQLKRKQEEIEALFALPVQQIIPCDTPWRYRNKMEYSFSMDLKGERYLGLYKNRGRVVNLEECHLVSTWFQTGLDAVKAWWELSGLRAYHPHKDTGTLRTVTFREGMRTGDRMVMLTVSGHPEWAIKKEQIASFVEAMNASLGEKPLSIFVKIHQAVKGRPTEFFEMHLSGPDHYREIMNVGRELLFHVSPSAFFQPNPQQAEKMYSIAAAWAQEEAKDKEGAIIWDLYCGTGTLSIALAPVAKQVIGVELSLESSLDARTNAKLNGLKNIEIVSGDVGEVLEKGNYPKPDIVVIDPPRAGLDKRALSHLIAAKPPLIIYIACNPKTQQENCVVLQEAGYVIQKIQPVDQFPHTPHIENMILLKLV